MRLRLLIFETNIFKRGINRRFAFLYFLCLYISASLLYGFKTVFQIVCKYSPNFWIRRSKKTVAKATFVRSCQWHGFHKHQCVFYGENKGWLFYIILF